MTDRVYKCLNYCPEFCLSRHLTIEHESRTCPLIFDAFDVMHGCLYKKHILICDAP